MRALAGGALAVIAMAAACFAPSFEATHCGGDDACPAGYTCSPTGLCAVCGDGIAENGEVCDDGNQSAEDACRPDCRRATCGDGMVDQAPGVEECDELGVDTATCDRDCTFPRCGDDNHNAAAGEACDNGLGGPAMGAGADSADCDRDCSLPTCQDGVANMEHDEQCDNGPDVLEDQCSPTCLIQDCGNSIVNPGEMCDDGNLDNIDDCRNDCLSDNTCGNGVTDGNLPLNGMTDPAICLDTVNQDTNCAEVCDDGDNTSGDGCSANCLSEERCGNGIVDPLGNPLSTPPSPPEVCDDGNSNPGDGCRDDCQGGQGCGNGLVDVGEQCDPGTAADTVSCDENCTVPVCGDLHVNAVAGEACDDGATTLTGDCVACRLAICGDGAIDLAPPVVERCDDANASNTDNCTNTCTVATCGDGFVDGAPPGIESCDDGNQIDGDGCPGDCTSP